MTKKYIQRWIVAALLAGSGLAALGGSAFAQSGPRTAATVAAPVQEPGVLVVAVEPGSPAAEAGIRRGDVILAIGDTPVNLVEELLAAIRSTKADEALTLTVEPGDEERTLEVTLTERNGVAFLGVRPFGPPDPHVIVSRSGGPLAGPEVQFFPAPGTTPGVTTAQVSTTAGMQISEVMPESPAAGVDLQAGDMIVSVDGKALQPGQDLAALVASHKPGDPLTLEVQRGPMNDELLDVTVTLAARPDNHEAAYLGVRVAPLVMMRAERIAGPFEGGSPGDRFHFRGQPNSGQFWFQQPVPGMPVPYVLVLPPMFAMPYGYGYEYGYSVPSFPPNSYLPPYMMTPPMSFMQQLPNPGAPAEQNRQFFIQPAPGAQPDILQFQALPEDQFIEVTPAAPVQWQGQVQDNI